MTPAASRAAHKLTSLAGEKARRGLALLEGRDEPHPPCDATKRARGFTRALGRTEPKLGAGIPIWTWIGGRTGDGLLRHTGGERSMVEGERPCRTGLIP